MSEPAEPPKRATPWIAKAGCLLLFVLFWVFTLGLFVLFTFPFYLAFGWILFVIRTLPEITVNLGAVLLGLGCLAGFIWASHYFFSWLYGEIRPTDPSAAGGHMETLSWSWRWTLSLSGLVILMFVCGTAATGVVHQVGWILTGSQSFVVDRSGVTRMVFRTRAENDWEKPLAQSWESFQVAVSAPSGNRYVQFRLPASEDPEDFDRVVAVPARDLIEAVRLNYGLPDEEGGRQAAVALINVKKDRTFDLANPEARAYLNLIEIPFFGGASLDTFEAAKAYAKGYDREGPERKAEAAHMLLLNGFEVVLDLESGNLRVLQQVGTP